MYTTDSLRRRLADNETKPQRVIRKFCEDELPRFVKALAPPVPVVDCVRTVDRIDDRDVCLLPYVQQKTPISGNRFHWGQLKLHLSEIEFFSMAMCKHGYGLFKRIDCISA